MDDTVEEWAPLASKVRPSLVDLPVDPAREFDDEEVFKFFELIVEDYGPVEIGLSLGWSPAMIKRFTGDPERAELIQLMSEAQNESVERAILREARAGNSVAMKLWAYNKMEHRGWADRRQVKVETRSNQEIVVSVRQALDEQIRQLTSDSGEAGIAALQAAMFEPDMPDHDIIDAEILEEDDADSDLYA